jgi:NADP-dependent 3-hydroxy acid dehydrogenase YdfG
MKLKLKPFTNFFMSQKTVIVTGGSSGIGKAIVKAFTAENFNVINADIVSGEEGDFFECDISQGDSIDSLYRYVKQKYGVPDVLISNAGQGIHEKLSEGDPEKWKRVMEVNFLGALRFVRAFVPEMIQKKQGDIVFVSSTAGRNAYEYGGVYAASKAALNMAAKTLQLELKDDIRVQVVSPGIVDTPFFQHMIGSNHTVEDIGLGSVSPKQVAEVVWYMVNLPSNTNLSEVIIKPNQQVV